MIWCFVWVCAFIAGSLVDDVGVLGEKGVGVERNEKSKKLGMRLAVENRHQAIALGGARSWCDCS